MNPIAFARRRPEMAGRRRLLLPCAFLGIAVSFTNAGTSRAQMKLPADPPHKLWNAKLTPEQIKAALAKLSLGDDENGSLHKLMREHLQQQFPEVPRELLDSFIKKAMSDPKFLDAARQQAQQNKTEPGRTPRFSQEDLAKLTKVMPRETDPRKLPPNVKLPDELKPQPVQPPRPPGKPPVEEKRPSERPDVGKPKEIVQPKGDAPGPPEGPVPMPQPGGVAPPPTPQTPEDTLFRPPDEPTDPRSKSLQAFAAVWERNIGPLDETPEVKRALFDLASSANGLNLDLLDDKGNSIWDLIRKGDGSGLDFGNFMDGSGGNWKLPNVDFPSLKLGRWFGRTTPRTGSSSSSWSWGTSSPRLRAPSTGGSGLGSFGFGGSWFPVVVLGVVVLGILLWVVLKNLRTPAPEVAYVAAGLGPWPVDPRRINTREDVVKAFEYLSVLLCGPAAKTWTHNTIADALADLASTHGETAVMLARLYELARYAPLDEPLTHEELMEARELVCGLAGVSY
jgi:hypothetical protein